MGGLAFCFVFYVGRLCFFLWIWICKAFIVIYARAAYETVFCSAVGCFCIVQGALLLYHLGRKNVFGVVSPVGYCCLG